MAATRAYVEQVLPDAPEPMNGATALAVECQP
jgi:hypothetical protein